MLKLKPIKVSKCFKNLILNSSLKLLHKSKSFASGFEENWDIYLIEVYLREKHLL